MSAKVSKEEEEEEWKVGLSTIQLEKVMWLLLRPNCKLELFFEQAVSLESS